MKAVISHNIEGYSHTVSISTLDCAGMLLSTDMSTTTNSTFGTPLMFLEYL